MKTYRKHLLAALSALTLGAAALGAHAQTADQAAPQARHGMQHQKLTPEQRAQFRAKRIAKLHDELKITPAQENAWNAFAASMQLVDLLRSRGHAAVISGAGPSVLVLSRPDGVDDAAALAPEGWQASRPGVPGTGAQVVRRTRGDGISQTRD